jgi:putative endonuclease
MEERKALGNLGEDAAVRFLEEKGYKILERNFRRPYGELDIVALAPDEMLVFVEVKTMKPGILKPEDQMTVAKRRKFARAASLYAGAHQELISDKKGWRLDLVALIKQNDGFEIRHYENI